ncbi:MAG TPA: hypothetical protein VNO31_36975, partial [Umezawaea sp.]|nr:hypothetical protein [Umezawaea sp.]
ADDAAADSPEVAELAATLEQARTRDPEFGDRLREAWEASAVPVSQTGRVTNQLTGPVHGKVVQAGDIGGNITL